MTVGGKLHVVFCADERYVPHLATSATSLLETNPDLDIQLHLMLYQVSPESTSTLISHLGSRYEVLVNVYDVSELKTRDFFVSGHVSHATYIRFFVGDVLPLDVSHVLYLDCDLIVVGSLEDIPSPPLVLNSSGRRATVAAVPETGGGVHLRKLGLNAEDYFNAGVMVIDLDEWRSGDVQQQLLDKVKVFGDDLAVWDQDALNLVLQSHWIPMPRKFNTIENAPSQANPLIIHFASGDKPWKVGNRHPMRREYRRFQALTPFDAKLEWDFQNLYRNSLPLSIRNRLAVLPRLLRRFGFLRK